MLEAEIGSAAFKEFVSAITPVAEEARLNISQRGLTVKTVDPANVMLVIIELQRQAFNYFHFSPADESEDPLQIGVDFERLATFLDHSRSDQVVFSVDRDSKTLSLYSRSLSYNLSLIDPSSLRKEPSVREFDFSTKVTLFADEFRRAIRVAENVGSIITIGVEGDEFFMEVQDDVDKLRFSLREPDCKLTPATVASRFTLEYLAALSKAARFAYADQITISLGKDYPVQIQFQIAEGNGNVTYLLAPRIE